VVIRRVKNRMDIGRYNSLKIDELTEFGFYLVDEKGERVLLPKAYKTENMKIGDEIEVFIYTDSEDRRVATTLKPKGIVGDFVALEVVDITNFGIFMDWGLPKHIFIPKKFQEGHYEIGETRVIKILEDRDSGRVYGVEKYKELLSKDVETLKRNQEVNLLVTKESELGFKVLIDEKFEGLLFKNRVFRELKVGDRTKGFIDKIRPDKKIDVVLQPIGKKSFSLGADKVLEILEQSGGKLNFTYKSSPEDISRVFGLSRKLFKRALTELIEKKRIELNEKSIEKIL
jgi:predicted RNA-binding protein (virulence factor B family)